MARLAGVDIPNEKRIEIALTYIFGVGRTRAKETLAATGINPDIRVKDLTDEQLKAIARKGGVVQVCLYSGFLRTDAPATICDAIEHLHHMVNIMGIEHVGIGTDFDGDGGIIGCNDSSELINLTRRMLYERYSENDLRLIWGGNFLRVMEEVQKQD